MTIASTTSRMGYTGDGSTTAFPVPFFFQANTDLVVYLQDTLGNQTLQTLGTNYNLTGATVSSGGTCTFTSAPTTGYLLTIYRDPPLTQTASYNNNDPFPAKSHELALDKLTTLEQRTRDIAGRSIHLSDAEAATTAVLASIATRKNKLLGFDTNGALAYVVGPTFVNSTNTGVAEVDSKATAQTLIFAGTVNIVATRGNASPGDGGGLSYVRGIISSPNNFQDAGGVYWTPATASTALAGANTVNSAAIIDGAIATADIAASAVTYAKIQNVAASSLLGNPTGSGAAPSEITLVGMAFSGSTLKAGAYPALIPNYLSGLTLSYSSTTVFGIAAGVANDSTNVSLMALASAYTKTTSAWALGSGNGGLDASSIGAASWYHVYLIQRPDTGVVDVLFSLSATSPTLPTNYTLFRRIGSILTASSQWVQFTQVGDQFIWAAPVSDVSAIATTTARVSKTLTVPTGVVVSALFRGSSNNSGGAVLGATLFAALIETDVAVTSANPGPSNADLNSNGTTTGGAFQRLTNTSAQIGVRSLNTTNTYSISTYGWIDTRGK